MADAPAGTVAELPPTVTEGLTADAVAERYERLTGILTGIVRASDVQQMRRCPYKDRRDRCTARFGCRNQRRIPGEPDARRCAADDRLDYRSAWEST